MVGGNRSARSLFLGALAAGLIGCVHSSLAAAAGGSTTPLPRLDIDPAGITVSGISSGGYMATQFHLAHSRLVSGAGIFAAGPWFCARGALQRALQECTEKPDSRPPTVELVAEARRQAASRRIDELRGLADDRVWLFYGTRDQRIAKPVADALADFYAAFVPADRIERVGTVPAGHGVPTLRSGVPCGSSGPPFLNACNYDAAGALLAHLYGPLAKPATATAALRPFDQRAYDATEGLAERGWLHVPAACARGERCRLHIVFHGCRQGEEFVERSFVEDAGYNRWAESNRIVVLYPQARRSILLPLNPQGCWDWWGYSGDNYVTREGPQLQAVRAMIRALSGR